MQLIPSPLDPLRVAIAEDHALLRGLIRAQLVAEPGVMVVGEAATGAEAVALVRRLRPDVLVLDVELAEGLDGVQVAAAVAGEGCRILAHSSHSDPVHVAHLLRAGASGYLSKEAPTGHLAAAVRAVAAGEGRWFEAPPQAAVTLAPGARAALDHLVAGGVPQAPPDPSGLAALLAALDACSWYEALARAWALGLIGEGRVGAPSGGYVPGRSTRAKVPGQASSASAGSYGA